MTPHQERRPGEGLRRNNQIARRSDPSSLDSQFTPVVFFPTPHQQILIFRALARPETPPEKPPLPPTAMAATAFALPGVAELRAELQSAVQALSCSGARGGEGEGRGGGRGLLGFWVTPEMSSFTKGSCYLRVPANSHGTPEMTMFWHFP